MTQFRLHRGSFAESMAAVEHVEGRAGLASVLRTHLEGFPLSLDAVESFTLEPRGLDPRNGWNEHLVVVDGYGVVGMTDGPV